MMPIMLTVPIPHRPGEPAHAVAGFAFEALLGGTKTAVLASIAAIHAVAPNDPAEDTLIRLSVHRTELLRLAERKKAAGRTQPDGSVVIGCADVHLAARV